jgi:hypothetical protein
MRSLKQVRGSLPFLQVVCDREEDVAQLKSKLEKHLEGVFVEGPKEIRQKLLSCGEETLARLSEKHVFWLKLGAILVYTKKRDILYADSDVLYFRDPEGLFYKDKTISCLIAQDYQFAYSDWLVDALRILRDLDLRTGRPGNAGFGIYRRGLSEVIDRQLLEHCLKRTEAELFDEQTFTAYTALTKGEILGKSDVYVDDVPITSWRCSWRGFPWVARHYIGPIREQFWIDAWQLLCFRAVF